MDFITSKILLSCLGLFIVQSFCGESLILDPLAPPLKSVHLKVDALDQAVSII